MTAPQLGGSRTYPRRTDADGYISASFTRGRIINMLRALQPPIPYPFVVVDGVICRVTRREADGKDNIAFACADGEVVLNVVERVKDDALLKEAALKDAEISAANQP